MATPSLSLNLAPCGTFSPPSIPSQSAYIIGHASPNVAGSEYKWTSPEVGKLLLAKLVIGDANRAPFNRALADLSSLSIKILMSVLFPAPIDLVSIVSTSPQKSLIGEGLIHFLPV